VISPISTGVSYPVPKPPTAAPVPLPPPGRTPLVPLADPAGAGASASSAKPSLDMFGGDLQSVDPQLAAALSALDASGSASGGGDVASLFDAALTTPNVSLAQSAHARHMTAGQDAMPGDPARDAGGVDVFA
jgi:hypothetical protein